MTKSHSEGEEPTFVFETITGEPFPGLTVRFVFVPAEFGAVEVHASLGAGPLRKNLRHYLSGIEAKRLQHLFAGAVGYAAWAEEKAEVG